MAGKWAALILVMVIAPAHAAIPEGTYSNVCVYPQTGDLGGVQLEVKYSDGRPDVLLWSCEGGCGWALITSDRQSKSTCVYGVSGGCRVSVRKAGDISVLALFSGHARHQFSADKSNLRAQASAS
jgi:hypothetical protein